MDGELAIAAEGLVKRSGSTAGLTALLAPAAIHRYRAMEGRRV